MAGRRAFLVPEVVQTSAMDCGPASLKCLLEGFGIPVSYGRLRDACQTDVDGTSIDTIEEVAVQLGLDAEQVMLPLDHLLLPESQAFPALMVVRQPNGSTHFVVVWSRIGGLVQIMDPATGRRWARAGKFLEEVYLHTQAVPASGWREWADGGEFRAALGRRLVAIGLSAGTRRRLLDEAAADAGWPALARLDAAVRMTEALAQAGGISRGREAAALLESFLARDRAESGAIPSCYWSVRPTPPTGDEETVAFRGAVLVRVRSRSARPEAAPTADAGTRLPADLTAALREPPCRPGREFWKLLSQDGVLLPTAIAFALALAAAGVVVEALLFRSLVDIGREIGLGEQRLGAMGLLLAFVAGLVVLEWPIVTGLLALGRRLEVRLRSAFLHKIPRLGDRYFRSRLSSDLAQRSHAVHAIRHLPKLGGHWLRCVFELALTTAGIVWLSPASAPFALAAAGVSLAVSLAAHPLLAERELRMRTHVGALARFYLDALLGLVTLRAHGAERAFRREHESLLHEWVRSGLVLQRAAALAEAVQSGIGFALAAGLLLHHSRAGGPDGSVLLLVYWSLQLPVLGQELALVTRQYPLCRNVTLRLLEPLGAPEEKVEAVPAAAATGAVPPATVVRMERVDVLAAGRPVLSTIDLDVGAGSHVAIVGPSGAGKSSLVGLLLGWHRPSGGRVLVDGVPLDEGRLERLRRETAWVDPAVQLWNRSLLANLQYGTASVDANALSRAIEAADLRAVLVGLPQGLQTPLGESGALVSGGEGQRVRLARGLLREGVRLAILDEPFRGLDRDRRRGLLARCRGHWRGITLLCVTHDVGETAGFDRVLVLEDGRIVEQGPPRDLAARPGSRYGRLLAADQAVRETLWSGREWRRIRLEAGRLVAD